MDAEKRGYSFVDLPTVIDPAQGDVIVWMRPWVGEPPEGRIERTHPGVEAHSFRRVIVLADDLPFSRVGMVNVFANGEGMGDATLMLAYNSNGVLTGMLARQPHGEWAINRVPEEMNGEHTYLNSVRLLFGSEAEARQVSQIVARLAHAARDDSSYPGIADDANVLVQLLMRSKEEPRIVLVAHPPRIKSFAK